MGKSLPACAAPLTSTTCSSDSKDTHTPPTLTKSGNWHSRSAEEERQGVGVRAGQEQPKICCHMFWYLKQKIPTAFCQNTQGGKSTGMFSWVSLSVQSYPPSHCGMQPHEGSSCCMLWWDRGSGGLREIRVLFFPYLPIGLRMAYGAPWTYASYKADTSRSRGKGTEEKGTGSRCKLQLWPIKRLPTASQLHRPMLRSKVSFCEEDSKSCMHTTLSAILTRR